MKSSAIPIKSQVSAGGVAFRKWGEQIRVALISVGEKGRWQLPKGLVNRGETPEATAVREVQEEAGIETELVQLLDRIEYWYYGTSGGKRVRFHKFVSFYLLRHKSGSVKNHDNEVNKARWFEIGQAQEMLAFESEKKIVAQAQAIIHDDEEGS